KGQSYGRVGGGIALLDTRNGNFADRPAGSPDHEVVKLVSRKIRHIREGLGRHLAVAGHLLIENIAPYPGSEATGGQDSYHCGHDVAPRMPLHLLPPHMG